MKTDWYLVHSGSRSTAENMAVDEVLLEKVSDFGQVVLRFYAWNEPGATFGYAQRVADVERLTALRPLVRRPTGGGLVPHAADWTYSLVVPPCDPWYELKARDSYRRVHEWLSGAFARLQLVTELAASAQREGPGQCFVGAEQHDLLWRGGKLAGAAQRRTRQGLLIQGSIQPPPAGLAKVDWQWAMCDFARLEWGVHWLGLQLEPWLETRSRELARVKYSSPDHNRRR